MIAFLSSTLGKAIAALVCAVAVCLGLWALYEVGKSAGIQQERMHILEQSVKVMRERSAIDGQMQKSTDADLCRSLGGVPDDNGKCM